LGPTYFALALGLLVLGHAVWGSSRARTIPTRIALLAGLAALLAVVGIRADAYIPERVSVDSGTADSIEALSEALRPVMPTDPATLVYGNVPWATWLASGLPVRQLPRTCVGRERAPSPTYHEGIISLGQHLRGKPTMVILITGEGDLRFGRQPAACRNSLSELAAALNVAVTPFELPPGLVVLTTSAAPPPPG
jgi:hypothetical protein